MSDDAIPPIETRGSLRTKDGLVLATATWIPPASKALVILAHGHAEHLGRYRHVIEALTQRGYAVAGLDHRGHGRNEGTRALAMRFDDYVDDLRRFVESVTEEQPGLPVFLVGHSMGGLIAARYALRYGDELEGLVTAGAAFAYVRTVRPIAVNVLRGVSRVVPRMPLPNGKGDTLSTDPAVSAAFRADPLCYNGRRRLRTVVEMFDAGRDALARASELRTPYLAMHGADDRLIDPRGTEAFFDGARSADKELRLWPGMWHEVFNEVERELVIAHLIAWLDARVS